MSTATKQKGKDVIPPTGQLKPSTVRFGTGQDSDCGDTITRGFDSDTRNTTLGSAPTNDGFPHIENRPVDDYPTIEEHTSNVLNETASESFALLMLERSQRNNKILKLFRALLSVKSLQHNLTLSSHSTDR